MTPIPRLIDSMQTFIANFETPYSTWLYFKYCSFVTKGCQSDLNPKEYSLTDH